MIFYTWKDVERYCLMNQDKWKSYIAAIDVYPDEIILYKGEGVSDAQIIDSFADVFPKNINKKDSSLRLDGCEENIQISVESAFDPIQKTKMPLFQQVIYSTSAYPEKTLDALNCPVIAFHSYKGGVGRTLSLLAFAKAWTNVHKKETEKLLIIDSDLEAPGLSWMQGETNEYAFSYLDLLTLIQDENDVEPIVESAVEKIGNVYITIETEEKKVQHIFLPTFRYIEQMFDLYASPDSVIRGINKEYVLAEVLSKIAKRIGASAVLVDLRAGISEYSSPLLLDPRVKKYFVTSTSLQSVVGMSKVLEYISKGLSIEENSNLPTVLLSMVPKELGISEKNEIIRRILDSFSVDEKKAHLLDNAVIELPFASELVHLTKLQQILDKLKGRDMYTAIEQLVVQNYSDAEEEIEYTESQREEILKKIYNFAEKQVTADAGEVAAILLTHPIKNLCSRFSRQIPAVVIRGTKGSGKTFLYRQLILKKNWDAFCSSVDGKTRNSNEGYFLPVFAPKNIPKAALLADLMKQCIDMFNTDIPFSNVSKSIYIDNAHKLEKQMDCDTDWMAFWENLFVSSISEEINTFEELSTQLKECKKKVIFLMDGLEEIFGDVSSSVFKQKAIQVLCQDVVNVLSARYDNIGIVIFLRSDMAQNAITVNYEQFKQAHSYADLRWTSEEALRLAVWVVSQSVKGFYDLSIPIEDASSDVIDRYLEKLWGLKLGKDNSNEAYSSRWILAALSDFNGQLQARDIIRFLKYAAKQNTKKIPYLDRILMPIEIRNAVATCSKEKIDETKAEYESLKPIFEKLEKMPSEKKVLPLNLDSDALTAFEEKMMMQEGYLAKDGGKLYLPEIIRHALGFRYEKGARPRVLSLLLKS